MSDCFDHEGDAWDSLERCQEEGIVTFDHDCNNKIIIGEYYYIDENDDTQEDYDSEVEVEVARDLYWTRLGNPEQSSSYEGDWDGKYLFFSPDRELLLNIAISEISEYGFKDAKVSINPKNNEHVLCLYWRDDERGYELMSRHGDNKDIKYRWWKSNADTRLGKYSKQYGN